MRIYHTMVLFLREWLRDKSTVFWTFVFPLLLLLIFGYIFGVQSGDQSYLLYVQDNDAPANMTDLSDVFVEALNSTNVIRVVPIPPGIDPVEYAVNNITLFRSPRILVIPEGFSENLTRVIMYNQAKSTYSFMNLVLRYISEYSSENVTEQIMMGKRQLGTFLNNTAQPSITLLFYYTVGDQGAEVLKGILSGFSQAFMLKAVNMTEGIEYSYNTLGEIDTKHGIIGFYAVAVILMAIMTNGVFGLSGIISNAKAKGLISKLATTPLRKHEMILGLILTETIIALMVTIVVLFVAYIVFGVTLVPYPGALLVILLGALCFSGLGALIGGLVKDPNTANALANVIVFPMLFLSGVMIPEFVLPTGLKLVAKVFPLYYFGSSLRATLIYHSFSKVVFDVGVILVLTIVFFVLGLVSFKWGEE